jgi:nitroreductase
MPIHELAAIIKARHSVRKWQDKPVPEELLKQAIELATWAPNAGNQQTWFFYIVLNRQTIHQMADAVQANADYVAAWPESARLGEAVTRMAQFSAFFRGAPAAIVVAAKHYITPTEQILRNRAPADARARSIQEGRDIASARIQSVASAVGYLLLALDQLGLGAVWMTGPMQAKPELEKILGVPREMDLVTYIPVGYPAENPPPRERKPVAEVCRVIR